VENVELEVIYENGTLKLSQKLPLQEGQKVAITVHLPRRGSRRHGLIQWRGSPEDLHYLILSDENSILEAR
jgi:predicted DNA-binding antitoxin AbrB/MazE fold protein